jgi:hypothetical protein
VTSVEEDHEGVGLKKYHFVSECYLEGVMKDETFSSTLGFDVEVEVFVLV